MNEKFHFIAIGGVGMSGLAKYLIQEGYEVSGSDISESKYVAQLRDLGAKIYIGHSKENVPEDAIVVISSAIRMNNPEVVRAKELGCKILHRSDVLAFVSDSDKKFIGFAGTHGKTTTSGMTSYVMAKANLHPSFVVGGFVPDYHTNAEYDKDGEIFIAEMDESDGTLVKYSPDIVVINNLEADHLDFYKNGLDSIIETFQKLFMNLKTNAKIIINNDNAGNLKLRGYDFITFGIDEAEYMAKNINFANGYSTFDIYHNDKILLDNVKIIIPGEHNVYNTLAVVSALNEAGVDVNKIKSHLATFTGMGRRFQKMLNLGEIPVYDDYAHHPTEINATLTAAKEYPHKEIWCIFQPHTYTRTKALFPEFVDALTHADHVILADIYAARETDTLGMSSEMIAEELKKKGCDAYYFPSFEEIENFCLDKCQKGDVLITMGAGNVVNIGENLLKR